MEKLFKGLKETLLPGSCKLCLTQLNHEQTSFCGDCTDELPHLQNQCPCCALPLIFSGICPQCQKKPPAYRRCIAAFSYQYPINKSIVHIKSNAYAPELKQLSLRLADIILQSYNMEPIPEVLIPMPLHWLKQLRRGFNQSQLIANLVAGKIPNCTIRNDICSRKSYRIDQHLQTRQQRWRSIADSFSVRDQSEIKGSRVALIDDVVTTGATVTAATKKLLEIGIKSVDIWCIARTGWHYNAS